MEIEFVGAAQTVTGSAHVVRTRHATVLLDCGLYQGRRQESIEKNKNLPIDVHALDAVVLSHAHIDHSGALPVLIKRGYQGDIFTTPASRDLAAAMLEDAAMIQAADARHVNKLIDVERLDMRRVEPLYDRKDVLQTLEQMETLAYHRPPHEIAPGVRVSFVDAGHVLGSAMVVLDIDDDGLERRICYSGDIGRRDMPILRDPEIPRGIELLVMESTYGDRLHPAIQEVGAELGAVITRTVKRGGKVVIPAFALERAQELVFALKKLARDGLIPKVPVYVDSPLTVKITDVFKLHPECYDEETLELLRRDSPFEFPELRYVDDKEESKAIDADPRPCVIISASGMCESGRVLHHLKAVVEDHRSTVCIVGFQAQHTLGRRLVEKRDRVKIFGVERNRHCEVVVLNGFSAHADQRDLVDFAVAARDRGKLRRIALVHGEPKAQEALRAKLLEQDFPSVDVPCSGTRMQV
ncbi:MAG: MBL fold metallo-hydrolase [Deltaproteobacteria bacterium]|nr:MBL fold metallo-hydrolase [Deltaproteobacteria bacterium]